MAATVLAPVRWAVTRLAKSGYRYSLINDPEASQFRPYRTQERRRKSWLFLLGVFAAFFLIYTAIPYAHLRNPGCELKGQCNATEHLWGQYSPYFDVPSDIDNNVPTGCEVTFGLVLSRHGARYPTAPKADLYRDLIERIQRSVSNYAEGFEFIGNFSYGLGKDDLTLFGQNQLINSGVAFYQRYKKLADESEPFVRAAGSDRVIMSAQNFTQGLYREKNRGHPTDDILVIPEGKDLNNTLDHGTCQEFEEGPASRVRHDVQDVWKKIWVPPIRDRLNKKMPGADLSLDDVIYFMDLCPFVTVADDQGKPSQFCKLYSEHEWRDYDYYKTLDKWYGYGRGNPLGPTQGVGYVNEVIARLTGKPVEDDTTTNSTLDGSSKTFPLDRTLYADFSHDNIMSSIYAAMGLYDDIDDFPADYPVSADEADGFSASWTVPFAGRMYLEKMKCEMADEEFVRVLINDRVVTPNCRTDGLGLCTLSSFIKSLSFARDGGLWKKCSV